MKLVVQFMTFACNTSETDLIDNRLNISYFVMIQTSLLTREFSSVIAVTVLEFVSFQSNFFSSPLT